MKKNISKKYSQTHTTSDLLGFATIFFGEVLEHNLNETSFILDGGKVALSRKGKRPEFL